MKLSIIIPIYNAEKYLSKCLDEVIVCPSTEMECLLINDGSTDASLQICEAYAKKDGRFKVFNIPNGGVSTARNTGLEIAVGKYVMFLDADDYINSEKWIDIVHTLDQDLDFVAYSYYTLFQNGNIKEEFFNFELIETQDIQLIRKLLLGSASLNTCWGKLFKLDLVKNHHISFRKALKTGEDAIFVLEYCMRANTFLLKNESVLYYRQHEDSVMHKLDIHSKLEDFKELFDCRKKIFKAWNDVELRDEMYRESFSVITNLLLIFSRIHKYSEAYSVVKRMTKENIVNDILLHVNSNHVGPVYKKLELKLMKHNQMLLLSSYFKLKSIFM